jgi:uncharacterized repeat protein (TIGR03803 family)
MKTKIITYGIFFSSITNRMKKFLFLCILVYNCPSAFAQYTTLLNFAGANGNYPYGSLISDGTFLYGMTELGGTNNVGVIFKIKPDGSGYVKLLDFAGTTNGSNPYGSLISDGIFLYGMTEAGGVNDLGTVFKIKPDGSSYIKLYDFAGSTNGSNPYGSLISDGTFLYGMTELGGINNVGVIFKIKSDGSGYVKLLDFAGATNGSNPYGSLISDGTFLYGMTELGGTNNLGTVFKIKPDGNGYLKLYDFLGSPDGSSPHGDLVSDGTFLYGLTISGGTDPKSDGTVFKIKPDGSSYIKLHDFTGITNGSNPYGSLISDGIFLYGTNANGNTAHGGAIFEIKPDGSGFTTLKNLGPGIGYNPYGSLISDGTYLYGMTHGNPSFGEADVVFKLGLVTGVNEINIDSEIKIYPNPSDGFFSITMEHPAPKTQMAIYNAVGEVICKYVINGSKSDIDLSVQPNGIYFIHINTEKGVAVKKIIVNK